MIPPPQSAEALERALQERQWTAVLEGLLCAIRASHLPATWLQAMRHNDPILSQACQEAWQQQDLQRLQRNFFCTGSAALAPSQALAPASGAPWYRLGACGAAARGSSLLVARARRIASTARPTIVTAIRGWVWSESSHFPDLGSLGSCAKRDCSKIFLPTLAALPR